MDVHGLTPALERLFLDEVHHHRRGGSLRNPNPRNSRATLNPNLNLRLLSSIALKKERKKKLKERKERKKQRKWQQWEQLYLQQQTSNPLPDQPQPLDRDPTVPDVQWAWEPTPQRKPETVGWGVPAPNPESVPPNPPTSDEELARIAAMPVQHNAVIACRDFFSERSGEDEAMGEDEDEGEDDAGESKAFGFFVSLFEQDWGLRGFYQKNWEKGDFCCPVCEGIRVKVGRRFLDCAGLVQHCSSISKTKRRGAHRAFGRALCSVLGWDIDRPRSTVHDPHDMIEGWFDGAANQQQMQGDSWKGGNVIGKRPQEEFDDPFESDNEYIKLFFTNANEITSMLGLEPIRWK